MARADTRKKTVKFIADEFSNLGYYSESHIIEQLFSDRNALLKACKKLDPIPPEIEKVIAKLEKPITEQYDSSFESAEFEDDEGDDD